ncbi:HEAT repeat domain-containing protein [Kovacikia minuta CCNUW1]|uniref:HEAT repeat domain-containing protein n=1 Tax=Kovacikia minuta TaxID=2931930 RepID=UPI001CCD0ABE|nr:HEAT repeat domain-containing protein [Kovacikia minuta]UBF28147.1 HEAT repeat domain-containing protein [Kovacikia minuta CCNUW1]
MTIPPEKQQTIVATLCKLLLEAEDPRIRARAARALGRLGNEAATDALCQAASQDVDIQVCLVAIDALVLIAKPELLKSMTEPPKNQPSFNINQVGNINTGDVTIQGDQVGIQHNYTSEQNLAEAAKEIQQLLEQLAQTYPTATEAEAPIILKAELEQMEQRQPERWAVLRRDLLNRERWFQGGKAAVVETTKHVAENNMFVKGAIAFLEAFSKDVNKKQ